MKKPTILLAEDDPNLAFVIQDHLEQEDFNVVPAVDGQAALEHFQNQAIDLCIVDVMMPRMDGFALAGKLRELNPEVPILFLTARSMEEDRLRGFRTGGDDYITKPFSIAELTYRVRVFLKRKNETAESPKLIQLGHCQLDLVNLRLVCPVSSVDLTQREADLMTLLVQNRNQLVKREEILVKVWGENDYFKGRSLDVFISRLRKYLKDDSSLEIRNHHGVGFTLIDR